jgi:hypothetical protein
MYQWTLTIIEENKLRYGTVMWVSLFIRIDHVNSPLIYWWKLSMNLFVQLLYFDVVSNQERKNMGNASLYSYSGIKHCSEYR